MNRGIIQFTSEEQAYLVSILKSTGNANELIQKLLLPSPEKLPEKLNEESDLEISEEDAELILDSLPVPQLNQDENIASCREKLNNFLATFRKPIA